LHAAIVPKGRNCARMTPARVPAVTFGRNCAVWTSTGFSPTRQRAFTATTLRTALLMR